MQERKAVPVGPFGRQLEASAQRAVVLVGLFGRQLVVPAQLAA